MSTPKAQKRAVLAALNAARVLIMADKETHYRSNVTRGGAVTKAERPLQVAYANALQKIDAALELLDAPAVVPAPCAGFLPKKLEKLGSRKK